ncbi:CD276 antigen-like [Anoplopoma fimbria]|uniref:CD276 antigen-like n=1 Tax=Anoplopoma fimbria TaxID=229290 RepID=UPI0023ED4AFD|nr:CD276 antigen-like [Anoplopoma fimbria]
MTWTKCVVFVVVLSFLQSRAKGDAEVSCVFMQSCILPCSFKAGEDLVLHWHFQVEGDIPVHSYFYNKDQLDKQNKDFKGRTSLFNDQISRGNASLLLRGVKVQDQGKYMCYISSNTPPESFINLKVDAPVHKVDIQQVENRITCSSDGIYPEPELTWSTRPPSNVTLQSNTSVQQNEQQLYSISSSLRVSDLDYSCTVSTPRNNRRATWFKPTSITGSDTETTIPCTSSNTPLTDLIWRFNHSQIILKQTGTDNTVSEEWRQQVKSVSEYGSLTLKELTSNQEGIYTCELSNAEETYVTNTFLRIEESPVKEARDSPNNEVAIVGVVIGAVVVLAFIAAATVGIYKRRQRQSGGEDSTAGDRSNGPNSV